MRPPYVPVMFKASVTIFVLGCLGNASNFQESCQVASAVIKASSRNNSGASLVISEDIRKSLSSIDSDRWFSLDKSLVEIPSKSLIEKFSSRTPISFTKYCSPYDIGISRKRIIFKNNSVDDTMKSFSIDKNKHDRVIVGVSLPVVGVDGVSALTYYSEVSGATAGGEYIIYLRKIDNRWKIVGMRLVSMS